MVAALPLAGRRMKHYERFVVTEHERAMNARVLLELSRALEREWNASEPPKPGIWERLTAFGVQRDYWDGHAWRRVTVKNYGGRRTISLGVVCANQLLPWRGCLAVD